MNYQLAIASLASSYKASQMTLEPSSLCVRCLVQHI